MSWRLPLMLFLMSSALLWKILGIRHGGDTPFYYEGARRLLAGQPLDGVAAAYSGYMAFLAAHLRFGLGEPAVIVTQLGLSALALLALYDLGRRLASPGVGVLAASLYALNADLHRFAFYVLSDSLATSVLVLSAHAAFRLATTPSKGWLLALVALAGLGTQIRLQGWFMLAAMGVYALAAPSRQRALWRWFGCAAVAVAMVLGVRWTLARSGTSGGFGALLYEGRVVWGDPDSAVPMPSQGTRAHGAADALSYCGEHPAACAALMARRAWTELAHTRAFYSWKHNVAVWATYPVLYLLALVGGWKMREEPFTWLAAAVVGLQLAVVGLTGADWDGRFILTVLPLVMLYSAIGAAGVRRGMKVRPMAVVAP